MPFGRHRLPDWPLDPAVTYLNHGTVGGKNLMTSYNHLTRFAVSSGQKVEKGKVIGYSGNTGLSGACHLHFEVYVNGSTIDPMSVLG